MQVYILRTGVIDYGRVWVIGFEFRITGDSLIIYHPRGWIDLCGHHLCEKDDRVIKQRWRLQGMETLRARQPLLRMRPYRLPSRVMRRQTLPMRGADMEKGLRKDGRGM